MTYKEFIDNILETRGRFSITEGYKERHHIIPKCMGGADDEDNLIDLYAKEHYEAHKLLALENSDNDCLVQAWWLMSHKGNDNQCRCIISPEEYEQVKVFYAEHQSKKFSGVNNPAFGRHWWTDGVNEVFAVDCPEGYYAGYSDENRAKRKARGWAKNDAAKAKYRENKLGDKNPMKNMTGSKHPNAKKVRCIETGDVYDTIRLAAEATGIGSPDICTSCKKGAKVHNTHWEYVI